MIVCTHTALFQEAVIGDWRPIAHWFLFLASSTYTAHRHPRLASITVIDRREKVCPDHSLVAGWFLETHLIQLIQICRSVWCYEAGVSSCVSVCDVMGGSSGVSRPCFEVHIEIRYKKVVSYLQRRKLELGRWLWKRIQEKQKKVLQRTRGTCASPCACSRVCYLNSGLRTRPASVYSTGNSAVCREWTRHTPRRTHSRTPDTWTPAEIHLQYNMGKMTHAENKWATST